MPDVLQYVAAYNCEKSKEKKIITYEGKRKREMERRGSDEAAGGSVDRGKEWRKRSSDLKSKRESKKERRKREKRQREKEERN